MLNDAIKCKEDGKTREMHVAKYSMGLFKSIDYRRDKNDYK
jgi:hypothetical protein